MAGKVCCQDVLTFRAPAEALPYATALVISMAGVVIPIESFEANRGDMSDLRDPDEYMQDTQTSEWLDRWDEY